MQIDLKNPDAKSGAEAALQILIKSKQAPIIITTSSGQGNQQGPKLTPPKNVEVHNQAGEKIPNPAKQTQDKQDKQDSSGSDSGSNSSQKDTPNTEKSEKNEKDTAGSGSSSENSEKEENNTNGSGSKKSEKKEKNNAGSGSEKPEKDNKDTAGSGSEKPEKEPEKEENDAGGSGSENSEKEEKDTAEAENGNKDTAEAEKSEKEKGDSDAEESEGDVGYTASDKDSGEDRGTKKSKGSKQSKSNNAEGESGDSQVTDVHKIETNPFNDAERNAQTMNDIKTDMHFNKERKQAEAEKAKDAWDNFTRDTPMANFNELESDLYYAIAAQIGESNFMDDTWEHGEDPAYADGELMHAQQDFEETKTKPLIYVFFDQSGSFGQNLINKGKSVLTVLDEFIRQGKIMQPKLFVFNSDVAELGTQKAETLRGGGTQAWPKCMSIIKSDMNLPIDERCTNVIVLSDSDIESQTDWGYPYQPSKQVYSHHYNGWNEKLTIEGCVFWCWAGNSRGKINEKYLTGEQGSFVYSF